MQGSFRSQQMDTQEHFSVLLKPFLSAGDKAKGGYKLS